MKQLNYRIIRLIWGLFLYALGIILNIKANIGYAPWEVFHVGLSNSIGLSIGTVSIAVGLAICIATLMLGEKFGFGSILNMILIGVFVDLILWLNLIPIAPNPLIGTLMLISGLFSIAIGSYFYIGSELGAGPRDSLMVALTKKTHLPIGYCRGLIELIVVILGWKLGGMIGFGTVLSAFAVGICIQITFRILNFEITKIRHESLGDTWKKFFNHKMMEKPVSRESIHSYPKK